MPRPRPVIPLLVGGLVFAACGTKEISRDRFVETVGRTCEAANRQLQMLPSPRPGPDGEPTAQSLAAYLEKLLAVNQEAADGVRHLKVPDDVRADRDRLAAAMDEANAGLADAAEAAAVEDQTAMEAALDRLAGGRATFDAAVTALDIPACRAGAIAPA